MTSRKRGILAQIGIDFQTIILQAIASCRVTRALESRLWTNWRTIRRTATGNHSANGETWRRTKANWID